MHLSIQRHALFILAPKWKQLKYQQWNELINNYYWYDGILHGNENMQSTITHNTDDSHRHQDELNKPKGYILHDSITKIPQTGKTNIRS